MSIHHGATTPMPQYLCHKKVWALKIKEVFGYRDEVWLSFEDAGFARRPIPHDVAQRCNFQPGGYYVQYEDGYESYSPAKAFEEGYTLIETKLHNCPIPQLDNTSLQDRELTPGIYGIGNVHWHSGSGEWRCLANVHGALCVVQVKVRPHATEEGVCL